MNAKQRIEEMGWETPAPNVGEGFLAEALHKHYAAIVGSDGVAVPDDEEEMRWRLFLAHSQDMNGFRADIFTGGRNESRNPFDPGYRGLRERFGDGTAMIQGLADLWHDPQAQAELTRLSHPKTRESVKAAVAVLRGPAGNQATHTFADALDDLRGANIARKTCKMVRAYAQNSALLARHGCSLRQYLKSVVPDLYLPLADITDAEAAWRAAITRDFYNVGPALASYIIADWLLWLWREGQIGWFDTYKADSVHIGALAADGLLPPEASQDFPAFCRRLRVPAEWVPARWWTLAFSALPPRVVNEAIWLERSVSNNAGTPTAPADTDMLPGMTDTAEWPRRTWSLPPYKSPAFMQWVGEHGGLEAFRASYAYRWAVERGLIAGDAWDAEAAGLPATVSGGASDSEEQAVSCLSAWVEMAQQTTWATEDLDHLRRLLSEAEWDTGGENDPFVRWPLSAPPQGEALSPVTLMVEGRVYLPVFTTLARLQAWAGEDNPYRIKTPISNVCRFLTTVIAPSFSAGTVVINPSSNQQFLMPPALVSALSGEPQLLFETVSAADVMDTVPPSQALPPPVWAAVRAAVRGAGEPDARVIVLFLTNGKRLLNVGLPTEDQTRMAKVWQAVGKAAGDVLRDWVVASLLSGGMAQLYTDFGEQV